jgi:hypothetical protein
MRQILKITTIFLFFILVQYGRDDSVLSHHIGLDYFSRIDSLIAGHDYFEANILFKQNSGHLNDWQKEYGEALLDNAFNKLSRSNVRINSIIAKYRNVIPRGQLVKIFTVKHLNHAKLFEYKSAYEAVESLTSIYADLLSSKELESLTNSGRIWKALASQPAQNVTMTDRSVSIPIVIDKAGLSNIGVTGNASYNFIFDTGANLSTCTKSTATSMEMITLEDSIIVTSITGKEIYADLAICPNLNIGLIKVQNAVFLVFPNQDLHIKSLDYQINGIIGFPIIEAFKKVEILKGKSLKVNSVEKRGDRIPMALNFYNPVISLNGRTYSFDTGAETTILYNRYYKESVELQTQSKVIAQHRISGTGGSIQKMGFKTPFVYSINDEDIKIDSVRIFTENIDDNNESLYGNIGQDVIGKFSVLQMNFDDMYIKLIK